MKNYNLIKELILRVGKENLKKLDFKNADFSNLDFSGADFIGADFIGADFSGADFSDACFNDAYFNDAGFIGADFSGANFSDAYFNDAYFNDADFSGADFSGANFSDAGFGGVDFGGTDFGDAYFSGADFGGADFGDAILEIKINEQTTGLALACPEEGSFIAYKKAAGETLVKLLIPEDAKRSSATTAKCRASKAKVLWIEGDLKEVESDRDSSFVYRLGEVVEVPDFDNNRWNECAPGIHFFINKELARQY